MSFPRNRVVVIKLGGSVLVDDSSYQDAARFLARRLQTRNLKSEGVPGEGSPERNDERLVVVVSARKRITDELERLARDTILDPSPRTPEKPQGRLILERPFRVVAGPSLLRKPREQRLTAFLSVVFISFWGRLVE